MIIDLLKRQSITTKNNKVRDWRCNHSYVVIDEKRRVIECKTCNQIIEPYDHLLRIANQESLIRNNIKYLRDELKELEQKKERINKDLTNLKAKLRRQKKA